MIAPVTKLARFQGQWWIPSFSTCTACFLCKGQRYHTEQEHELVMRAEGVWP